MSKVRAPENIQVRIRKNQSRASAVGITYWMAAIVLFVLSIFPYVGSFTGYGIDGHLWSVSFLDPLLALFSAKTMTGEVILHGVASILYACLLVFTLINFIIATTRLFRITKKNPTNKLGYNRASKGAKTLGKAFARMFFWMLTVTVSVLLLGDGSFTLFFYIAFAVALLCHFVCNFVACKISYFQATEDRFKPIERVRTEGRVICVLRNAWQFVSIILIVVFMDKFGLMLGSVFNLADAQASATIMQNNLFDGVVIPVILLMILVCLIVCIRHATGVTEYHEFGLKARGMKTCRIFATAIAILALVGAVVVLLVPEGTVVPKWAFFAIFAVAAQWVGAENMFAELSKKVEDEESVAEEEKEPETKKEKKSRRKLEKIEKAKKKLERKEKLARILNDEDADYELPVYDESMEESPVTTGEETVVSETPIEETVVSTPVVETKTVVDELPTVDETPTVDGVDGVVAVVTDASAGEAVTAEIVETETVEESAEAEEPREPVVMLSEEEIEERRTLKNKWINMALDPDMVVEEPQATMKEKQLVYCPNCNKKLSVKFGTEVAKCPACESMFVLRKLTKKQVERPSVEEMEEFAASMPSQAPELFAPMSFGPNFSMQQPPEPPVTDQKESFEDPYEKEISLADQYLAEAEAELKRFLYSDDPVESEENPETTVETFETNEEDLPAFKSDEE